MPSPSAYEGMDEPLALGVEEGVSTETDAVAVGATAVWLPGWRRGAAAALVLCAAAGLLAATAHSLSPASVLAPKGGVVFGGWSEDNKNDTKDGKDKKIRREEKRRRRKEKRRQREEEEDVVKADKKAIKKKRASVNVAEPVYSNSTKADKKASLKSTHASSMSTPAKACTTTDGTACVFPFTYAGETYTTCSSVHHHGPWCPTHTDSDGNYVGEWGDCSDDCQVSTTCSFHDDCSASLPFCYKGSTTRCESCDECHYCNDGVDGTCGSCDSPTQESGPCGEGEPTPATSCSDTSGDAVGNKGYTCDFYTRNPDFCRYAKYEYDDEDFTVEDMCCVCGGGE